MPNHTTEGTGITGEKLMELCQSHELVRYAIPAGFELLLPRIRRERAGGSGNETYRWVAECWWRSAETGALGYFVKMDPLTESIREFRELPGDIKASGMIISDAEMAYLDQCKTLWDTGPESGETADVLDVLWKSLVPDSLREYAFRKEEACTVGDYLLPVEALSCWKWETLRDMLLKRENTTVEGILDYIEYKRSGSDKCYIAPEQRAEAKARGIRFWRDEDDV